MGSALIGTLHEACAFDIVGSSGNRSGVRVQSPSQSSNDDAACPVIRCRSNPVVDIENQLGHVVVPIKGDHGLGSKPTTVCRAQAGRHVRGQIIDIVEDR